MSSMSENLRGLLERSYLAFPLLLFGYSVFMGATTGNVSLLVLALGQGTVVPILSWMMNLIVPWLGSFAEYFTSTPGSNCSMLPGAEPSTFTLSIDGQDQQVSASFPSVWMAQVAFFFGFLISNATAVKDMTPDPRADKTKVEARKAQSQMVLIVASIVLFLFWLARIVFTGCESPAGATLGALIFASLGKGWYEFARACSAKDSDIFGIVQGILPPSAMDKPPMTCVYQG